MLDLSRLLMGFAPSLRSPSYPFELPSHTPPINATFYTELTPEAKLATRYVAPFLVLASIGCFIGGIWSQYRRRGAWERIKQTSNPVEAFATPIIVAGEPPSSSGTNAAE
jgi:hypothetical protein